MTKKILVVEDQQDINTLIVLNLTMLEYEVESTDDGLLGYNYALQKDFDLIVLDIMLPNMNGLKICESLRAKQCFTPILMLTAKRTELDRVLGLDVGADDYLTKPFSVLELQARVKALLRRSAINTQRSGSMLEASRENESEQVYGDLVIQKSKRLVHVRGEKVSLTAKEFDLLQHLSQSPGQVFNREQLLDAVWGYQHCGYEHTVNSHINRLRAKLEQDPAHPEFVLTVWGVGYKFGEF